MQTAATFVLEQLHLGQRVQFETTITERDIDAFAELSGDDNPLHTDADFAQMRGYPDRIMHGAHLVALASRLVGKYLPGRNALLLTVNASFVAPVPPGTRMIVSGEVVQLSETVRSAILKLLITHQTTGVTLARGRLTVGFTDRGRPENQAYG